MITKFDPKYAGCLIDSHYGIFIYGMIVDLAVEHGWYLSDEETKIWSDEEIKICHADHEVDSEGWESLIWLSERAEEWLNGPVAPEGYTFGWHDGEFFLQTDEWWENNEYREADKKAFEWFVIETGNPDEILLSEWLENCEAIRTKETEN